MIGQVPTKERADTEIQRPVIFFQCVRSLFNDISDKLFNWKTKEGTYCTWRYCQATKIPFSVIDSFHGV